IGHTFNKVKKIEKYLIPSAPVDEIGILLDPMENSLDNNKGDDQQKYEQSRSGTVKLLSQLHYQFSLIDEHSPLTKYALLVLPDYVTITSSLKAKLKKYLAGGGKILLSYESGLDKDGKFPLFPQIKNMGQHPYRPYYVYPCAPLKKRVPDTENVQYLGGLKIKNAPGWEKLTAVAEPYFNRAWDHFCSHLQTPPEKRTATPEMIYNRKNIIYLSSPVFSAYQQFAQAYIKAQMGWTLSRLLPEKLLESNLPSTAETALRRLPDKSLSLGILHYIHQRRTPTIDIIEEVIPLYNREIILKISKKPETVLDCLTNKKIPFTYVKGRLNFVLKEINGYRVINIS
ncbi:MAG TPA: beta-galactosidase trimerization domain-containing protein, partial [Spirochaetota bacterium]|nr:beta-galactosidase trimerization domain-containing protein [Spirochaetota bacterium]